MSTTADMKKGVQISTPFYDMKPTLDYFLHICAAKVVERGSEREREIERLPSYLLQVDKELMRKKLTSRIMESKWGASTETVDVTLNVQQAESTRDALAKGLYSRLFDYLVKVRRV